MAYTTLVQTAVATLLITAADAAAASPVLGEVQRLQVITISMHVGSTDKDSKQVTYTPPPGWFIRSHSAHCSAKTGHTSFSIHTVPQDWKWSSEETIRGAYSYLIDLAGKAQNAGLQARFAQERNDLLRDFHRVRSTHHALVVEATSRGEGFLRGGGSLELTVTAEMVYLGTEESVGTLSHRR